MTEPIRGREASEAAAESSEASAFDELGLIEPLQRAVRDSGYAEPTPIQTAAIPQLLEGRDLLGCAQTGTGKTAAFALPILQRLAARRGSRGHAVRALILVPTRELAAQVAESFRTYGRYVPAAVAVIYGGVGQGPQVHALSRGADVVVATPGRLLDLMNQGHARLGQVEILVLDEADHMLDLGFIPDVRRIVSAIPKQRQTLLFSATMPPPIMALAHGLLNDPAKVFVTPNATTVEAVDQRVHFVAQREKPDLLADLLRDPAAARVLVFTRTKHGANKVARGLNQAGIAAEPIHGNKSQTAREHALRGFRNGRVHVLVATDIAARGIDVDGITHVVNFELPNIPETYVHRIGRTARAGARGIAISLCDPSERPFLRSIEKLIRRHVPVVGAPDRHGEPAPRRPHHAPTHAPVRAPTHSQEPQPSQPARPHHAPHQPPRTDAFRNRPRREERHGGARGPASPAPAGHSSGGRPHSGQGSGKTHEGGNARHRRRFTPRGRPQGGHRH